MKKNQYLHVIYNIQICNFVSFSTLHFKYSFQSTQSLYRVTKYMIQDIFVYNGLKICGMWFSVRHL